jgi:mannose-6-phosphate isomerase-like protein (cupin superfamily)
MDSGIVVLPGEGTALLSPSGLAQHLKAGASDTGGAYSLWESVILPGEGPRPHVHPDNEEAFYLLEDELILRVRDQDVTVGPGTFALVPRGAAHAFTNPAATPARMLTIMSPPMDRFRAALTELIEALPPGSPRTVSTLDPAAVRAVEAQFGVRDRPV